MHINVTNKTKLELVFLSSPADISNVRFNSTRVVGAINALAAVSVAAAAAFVLSLPTKK